MRPLGVQIAHMLKARGVECVFGIPGVHNIELYRGLSEAGITHVLARHEQGAGFMADGYARATGRPGVVFTITGPGLTNVLTPLGQAYSDSVPVLAISSCLDDIAGRRGQLHQMLDQRGAAATVCDWSEEARTPQAAFALINRAFQEFHSARPRPKHVQIPIALLGQEAPPHDPGACGLSDGGAQLDAAMAPVVPQMLREAKRPLLILGGGARDAAADIRALLARCPMAVFTTYAGRGLVAADYPLGFGSMLARPQSAEIMAQADLVITVGAELGEVDLWRTHLGATARLVRVDIDPAVLADGAGQTLRFNAAAHGFFRQVAAAEALPATFDWSADEVARTRARWRAEIDAGRPGIVPICDALQAGLPDDVMVYSDMTRFAYVAKEVWDMARPGHWHHPTGFGTLGYALPAAIGGAVARAGQGPTLAIAGDYGFQYTLPELGTAVELGLPLVILIWDNEKLGEIEASMQAAQIAPMAVHTHNPDFLALARAYGAGAEQPDSLEALVAAVRRAFAADRPTLIRMTPALTA